MQKVMIVNVLSKTEEKTKFNELELEKVNKHLEEGFKIVQFHQIAPSDNLYCVTLTFILEKN